jgi:phospholipase/carboxylesterase
VGVAVATSHIPVERAHETRDVLEGLDADATERIYKRMGHGINQEELEYVKELVESVASGE